MTTPFTSSLINGELAGALLQAAFTTVGEAILSINSDSYIVMANPEIEHVFGYQPEELLGQHLHMLMPEKYREAHSAGLHRYLTTGVAQVLGVRLELEGLRKGGVVFPLEIRITPTLIKQQRFFTAAVRDISQRQEEELQIQDQQTRLERQNRQYNRAYHFFLFTLENMEIALRMGGIKRNSSITFNRSKPPLKILTRIQRGRTEQAGGVYPAFDDSFGQPMKIRKKVDWLF